MLLHMRTCERNGLVWLVPTETRSLACADKSCCVGLHAYCMQLDGKNKCHQSISPQDVIDLAACRSC